MTRLEAALAELASALREEMAAAAAGPAAPDKLYSIEQAARELSLGRTLIYSEIGRNALRSVKCGRRRMIPASALRDYIAAR